MTNYTEILRLHSLGINNTRAAESCGCALSIPRKIAQNDRSN